MSKFLKTLVIFTLVLSTLAYLIDTMISKGLRKTDLRIYQAWNDIYASNIKSDALILGSSRAWCQYNPKILDSIVGLDFYNLGIDGHKIDYQLIRYNTYRRFYPKPRLIIHNVEFSTLGLTNDGYEREQFFPFVFDDSLLNEVSETKKITILERKLPLIRYFGYRTLFENGLKSYFGKTQFTDGGLIKGYRGNSYPWDGIQLNKIKSVQYEENPNAIKIFDNYLQKSKNEGITVILVFAPIYFEGTNKIVNYRGMLELYSNLAKKYNFQILDFTNDSISFDKGNFYNATHLNKSGAEKFSIKLGNELNSILKTTTKPHFYDVYSTKTH